MKPKPPSSDRRRRGARRSRRLVHSPRKPPPGRARRRGTGKLFLPNLADRADVASITIKRPELAFTVQRGQSGAWTIPDKANYPAKAEAVRGLLVGLSELREWEPKTDQPSLYSKLGVEDPVAPPVEKSAENPLPQSTLVTLKDGKGETISEVIVGNCKWGSTTAKGTTSGAWPSPGQGDGHAREVLGWLDARSRTSTAPGSGA
jgi:hypothetical protein